MLLRKFTILFISLFIFPAVASSETWFSRPSGFSDYVPQASKPSIVVSTDLAGKDSYSSGFLRFWEDLTGDAIDSLCKSAQIKLNTDANFPNDISGIKAGYKRYLRRFPNSQIALIDEISLNPHFAMDMPISEMAQGNLPFSIKLQFNSSISGKSQVVRPLKGEEYCTELKTLVKLYNMKTAWPATQKRIAEMNIGEIWKLPLTFHIQAGVQASATAYNAVTFALGSSVSKELSPSVTLFRMSKDKMRLRVRIGMAKMYSAGASASTISIPVEDLALWHTDNHIAKILNKEWAKEINKVLEAKFSFTKTHYKGKKLVLEFICNPQDPEQLKAIVRFMRGDFGILKKFIDLHLDFTDFSEEQSVVEADHAIHEMANIPNSALQAAQSYAGASTYDGKTSNTNLQLPIIYKRESQKEKTETTYQAADSKEKMYVYKSRKYVKSGRLNLPFAGSASASNSEATSYVVQKEYEDGSVSKPVFMYKEYAGGLRVSGGKAESSVEKANDVLKYVGTRGQGINENNMIKTEDVLPKEKLDSEGKTVKSSKIYSSVASEFNLMISARGIQEIIFAPAAAIMKSLFNILPENFQKVLAKAGDLFVIDEAGKVSFDSKIARQRLGYAVNREDNDPLSVMRKLAAKATNLIAELFEVKNTSDEKEQTKKFSKLSSGGGSLGASDFLKVAVQLLDPSEVTASFTMDSKNKNMGKHHYKAEVFNPSDNFDKTLSEVQEAEGRFSEPSILAD